MVCVCRQLLVMADLIAEGGGGPASNLVSARRCLLVLSTLSPPVPSLLV